MKYIDEYRDAEPVRKLARVIRRLTTRPWTLMEICGGQTHSIVKFGLDELLPSEITLVHGPGCPVCVTPVGIVDQALAIAKRPEVLLCDEPTGALDSKTGIRVIDALLTINAQLGTTTLIIPFGPALNEPASEDPVRSLYVFPLIWPSV